MLGAAAEFERGLIRERVLAGTSVIRRITSQGRSARKDRAQAESIKPSEGTGESLTGGVQTDVRRSQLASDCIETERWLGTIMRVLKGVPKTDSANLERVS